MDKHTGTATPGEMMRADSDLFAQVMNEQGVKPEQIAMLSGISAGHLRRIMDGQYPPTAIAWRALYRLTKDARLISFLLGDASYYIYPLPADNGKSLPELLVDQTMANALVVRDAQARDNGSLLNSIRDAIDNLQRIYTRTHAAPIGATVDIKA